MEKRNARPHPWISSRLVKCRQRARDILIWPGMSSQIEGKVSKCFICSQLQRAQLKEPMVIQELPGRLWDKIGSDLFGCNGVPAEVKERFRKENWKRNFTMISAVVKSFHLSSMVKRSRYSIKTGGYQPQWSVSTTYPDHTLFKHQRVRSIGETADTWTNAQHRRTYQQRLRIINPRHHQIPTLLKLVKRLFPLQKHHLHNWRNLQFVFVPDDC